MRQRLKIPPKVVNGASVGGGILAGIGTLALGGPLPLGLAAGAIVLGSLKFLILRPFDSGEQVAEGFCEADVEEIIERGRDEVRKLRWLAEEVYEWDAQAAIEQICDTLDKTFVYLDGHPEEAIKAQKFLEVYLDRAVKVIEYYVRSRDLETKKAGELRRRIERELLPALVQACQDQYERILDVEVESYDTDVKVLKDTLTLNGINGE